MQKWELLFLYRDKSLNVKQWIFPTFLLSKYCAPQIDLDDNSCSSRGASLVPHTVPFRTVQGNLSFVFSKLPCTHLFYTRKSCKGIQKKICRFLFNLCLGPHPEGSHFSIMKLKNVGGIIYYKLNSREASDSRERFNDDRNRGIDNTNRIILGTLNLPAYRETPRWKVYDPRGEATRYAPCELHCHETVTTRTRMPRLWWKGRLLKRGDPGTFLFKKSFAPLKRALSDKCAFSSWIIPNEFEINWHITDREPI